MNSGASRCPPPFEIAKIVGPVTRLFRPRTEALREGGKRVGPGAQPYTATGTVAAGASGTMTNTVTVAAADTADPDPSDNTASDETIVSADLLFADGFETGSTSTCSATVP